MDYRQNFKTALKEIFLLHKNQNREERPTEKQDIAALVTEAETAAPKLVLTQPRKNDRKKSDPSVISEDTAINGEVVSKGSLDIRGSIIGNVITKGDIVISGSVEGKYLGRKYRPQGMQDHRGPRRGGHDKDRQRHGDRRLDDIQGDICGRQGIGEHLVCLRTPISDRELSSSAASRRT